MFTVEVLNASPCRIAAKSHIGPYPEIGSAFQQLATMFTSRKLWGQARGMLAICYDDPEAVAPENLRGHAGVIVGADFEMPAGLESVDVPDGKMAVMHYKGPYAGLKAAYDHLYGNWLNDSAEALRDAPSFEVYLNDPMDTKPDDLLTDICVPLIA